MKKKIYLKGKEERKKERKTERERSYINPGLIYAAINVWR